MNLDSEVLWRAALVQLAAVAVVSIALAVALPKSFFESWGWLSGPTAWLLCAYFTARVVGLSPAPTLLGAALAGIPSLLFVVLGLHWAGALLAVGLFATWCARLPRRPRAPAAER